jgi:pimeloyl-ACP methyl ester carboxylesterase
MHIHEIGAKNGPTIVFLHGGGMSGWIWKKQIEHFKDYHCLIPDLPGHGKSNEPLISLRDCAQQVAELIERNGHNKVIVVGYSLGAKVAVELLNIKPDLVDYAVIVSAFYRPTRVMLWLHKPWVYKLTVWLVKYKKILELQAKLLQFKESSNQQNFIKDTQLLTATDLQKIYDMGYDPKLSSSLTSLKTAVLVMAGAKEPKAMRQSVTDLVNVIPHAKGVLVRAVNHTFPWTEADLFNKIVRQWITDIPLQSDSIYEV